jgi:hypothetical protein
MAADKWYNDATVLAGFVSALHNAEYFEDIDAVVALLSKPFQYNDEYDAWESAGFPAEDSDNGWEDFADAVSGEESAES